MLSRVIRALLRAITRRNSASNATSESLTQWLRDNPPGSPERMRFDRYHDSTDWGK